MQSQDDKGNVVGLFQFDKLMEAQKQRAKAEAIGAVSHTIGRLPVRRHRFILLGMQYEVTFVDTKRAKIQARMVDGSEEGAEIAGEVGERDPDLHEMCVLLAAITANKNGIGTEKKGFASHVSYVTAADQLDFELPTGKVMKVTVEFVDESETIPPG